MAPPTPLSVATNSINRLLKEESSYRTELATQQRRVDKLQAGGGESDDDVGNMEFRLRQEKQAVEETKAVFGPLRERISGAVEKLEGLLASGKTSDGPEVEAAKNAVARAKASS